MRFNEWLKQRQLKETVTDTGDVATFARPILGGNWRMYPPPVVLDGPDKKHERRRKKDL